MKYISKNGKDFIERRGIAPEHIVKFSYHHGIPSLMLYDVLGPSRFSQSNQLDMWLKKQAGENGSVYLTAQLVKEPCSPVIINGTAEFYK